MDSVSSSLRAISSCLLLIVSLAALADSSGPLQRLTIAHEGTEREYFVHVPPNAEGPLPVVVGIHGYTSTATGFANSHQLNAHADANGYIAVYPQGTHFLVGEQSDAQNRITAWNSYGEEGPDFSAAPHCTAESTHYDCPPGCGECHRCQWEPCTNDVAFVAKVLDDVETKFDTDTSRYYVLGVSNGGMMTLRIACDLSDRFAAAAPIIGLQPPGHVCAPSTDLPILFLMGAKDETIRYDGKAGQDDGFIYATLAESTETHARALQCEAGPSEWPSEWPMQPACNAQPIQIVACPATRLSAVWTRMELMYGLNKGRRTRRRPA